MLSTSFTVLMICSVLSHSKAGYHSRNSNGESTSMPTTTESTDQETTFFPPFVHLFIPLTIRSLGLYQQLTTDNSTPPVNNFFFSPLSTMSALLLAYEGTGRAFDSGAGDDIRIAFLIFQQFHGFSADVDFPYISTLFRPGPVISGSPAYELYVANRAYMSSSLTITDSYKSTISTVLNSTVGQADFGSNQQAARNEINDWVKTNTNNKVTSLVSDTSALSPRAMVIVNALYFKPDWKSGFNRAITKTQTFNNLDGSTSRVLTMIKQNETMLYFDNLQGNLTDFPPFQMVSVPMKGDLFEFLVFVPRDRDGLADFETAVSTGLSLSGGTSTIDSILRAATNRTYSNFRMPKFFIKSTFDPKAAFNSIDISLVFEPSQANMTHVTANQDRLFVSRIYSQAIIEVDEGGSGSYCGSNESPADVSATSSADPVSVVANQPFLFAIVDKQTKITVFMGRVTQL